jgi:nucleoside-diphosphate-sugar epimerase
MEVFFHMKVLVTGGSGYIGSILVRKLLEKGHYVRVMDVFKFGFDPLREIMPNKNLEIYPGDIKNPTDVSNGLKDMDAIVHLAAIVGDPACFIQADNAVETNYLSTLRIAIAAREKGIKNFIFASTCSVYGCLEGMLTEESVLKPQSLYAETKVLAEQGLLNLKTENFRPIILRLGTLYGLSFRPRFDLVINYLTGKIITENKAMIFGGDQWRPFLHVHDAAEAFSFALENRENMIEHIYNIGANKENYQMKDIGIIFKKVFPNADIQSVDELKDPRSYKVSFKRIEDKGYHLEHEIEPSIRELLRWITENKIDPKAPIYYNYHP